MLQQSESVEEVRRLLLIFNEGHAKRDLDTLDDFMSIFAHDDQLEYIATGGVLPGRGTWRLGRNAVQKLIRSDWDYWGKITVDVENARINVFHDAAWLSAAATITTDDITEEFLGDKVEVIGRVHQDNTNETRIKPLRMTAVLIKREGRWQFQQIHLSFSVHSLPKYAS